MPILCQSSANHTPIGRQLSRSVSTEDVSDDQSTIRRHSSASPRYRPTTFCQFQGNLAILDQSISNPRPICQSNANPMPIHEEICTTKYEFCQFSTNLVILCQSWTNSQTLCQSSANPMRICQSTNHWPVQGKSHRQDIGTH